MRGERTPEAFEAANFAGAYQAVGRLDEAIPQFEPSLADCVAVLGEQHRDTGSTRRDFAEASGAAGRFGEATQWKTGAAYLV